MAKRENKTRFQPPKSQALDIRKIVRDFEESERSTAHRKGTFKIAGNFEDAVRKIAKAMPKPKGR